MQSNRGQESGEDFSRAILFATYLFDHSGEFVRAIIPDLAQPNYANFVPLGDAWALLGTEYQVD